MSAEPQKRTFAVIGNPVEQSLSPLMHNAAFADIGIDAEYTKIKTEESELSQIVDKLRTGELRGFNVTIPFKEKIIPHLDETTPAVKKIGACNTVFLKNGRVWGDNTDGLGYYNSLTLEMEFDVANKNILVLGSGGAAKAICHVLCEHNPASLTIANRSQNRSDDLANELRQQFSTRIATCAFPNFDAKVLATTDVLINCTSLGLKNNPWSDLSFVKTLPHGCIVSDIVYNPRETELLKKADSLGLQTHYGSGMLVHQGALAFEIWTGLHAPTDVMADALLQHPL